MLSQNTRDPRSWAGTADEITNRLFTVRIDELRALQVEHDYLTGDALAAVLFHDAPGNRVLLDAIEQYYVRQAEEFLNDNHNLEGRLKLEVLRDKFRNPLTSTLARRVVERLEDFARKHLDVAKEAADANDRSKALANLESAEAAWPTFPGLRELREKLLGEFAVLRIGVRTLPRHVSPMTALTDVDKIAGRLLFEPLLTARAAPSSVEGYKTVLSETPRRLTNGYEFVLPANLTWSDGSPAKTDDVLRSLELVTAPGTPLFDPSKANNAVFSAQALDESRIAFTFNSAPLDPLTALTFPILPAHRLPRERSALDPAFDKQPVGTGPFVLAGTEGDEVIFRTNPQYKRTWAPTGPRIKEIRFIQYSDWNVARRAFLDGRWQMLIEVSSKEVEELSGQPQSLIFTPTEAKSTMLTNPRIYFLAINHRKPYLQNVKAREAIYYAIDRRGILDKVFRGKNQTQHQELNGPFPLGSWAYDMNAYNPAQKSAHQPFQASAARNNAGNLPELKLVVLAEDGPGQAACALIKDDLAKANIQAVITPMASSALLTELTKEQPNFDLLYTNYDFDSEALNLQPLLDSDAAGGKGRNYMGYQTHQPDNQLMQLFRAAQTSRDFNTVQRQMFAIHDHVIKNVILVPLWQLDRPIAVHRSLDNYQRFHPLYVFDGTENWTLKASK
jgi:ABC-type transport system substrate-binding protein